jgi:SPP1 family predicted phage head-tail adaptor
MNEACVITLDGRTVYAELRSIRQNEYFAAQAQGLKPQYCFVVREFEWNGEDTLTYDGRKYAVYRVYKTGDNIELYVTKKAGVV